MEFRPWVLSQFWVYYSQQCTSVCCRISLRCIKCESTMPAISYVCRGKYSYILNMKHLNSCILSQSPHHDTPPAIQNVRGLFNHPKQQQHGPVGNSQLLPAKRRIFLPAGEWDSSQGGSSMASTIHGQNSSPWTSLNNSHVANITQHVTSTQSATPLWSINTATATLSASGGSTPAAEATSQIDSLHHVVFSPTFGITTTTTPLYGLDNPPTTIPNPIAHTIIINPLLTWATERNHWQRQWQLQPQVVSTSREVVSSSCSIHHFGHSDWRFLYLQQADSWSSTCASDSSLWVQATWRW